MDRVILANLVNGQDVWVIQPNYRAGFLLKPLQPLSVSSKTNRQDFERGFTARHDVRGKIDFAHPATAYRFRNLVVANLPAGE